VTRPDFYLESSGGAGIAAAMRRTATGGWLDGADPAAAEPFRQAYTTGRAAVVAQIAPDGTVRNVSAGTGAVNDDINRYNGIDRSKIQPYGQGLVLMLLSAGTTANR
jgi:rhamnogalacturonyl hydrolase YesR